MRGFIYILVLVILFSACKRENESQYDNSAFAVISGHIQNRAVYPQQKEIKLIIPYFDGSETVIVTDIREDNTFSFRFQPYVFRDVAIETFAPNIFIRPGDSLHLEMDFRTLDKIAYSGSAGKLNDDLHSFIDGGYYLALQVGTENNMMPEDKFLEYIGQEYAGRQKRADQFVRKFEPESEVQGWIEQRLKMDYFDCLLQFAKVRPYYARGEKVSDQYYNFISDAENLFGSGMVNSASFQLARNLFTWQLSDRKETGSLDSLGKMIRYGDNNVLKQYYLAESLCESLEMNETDYFEKNKDVFDREVTSPFLREPLLRKYEAKKAYQVNPKPVSDAMLQGKNSENSMIAMQPQGLKKLNDIIRQFSGKIIYINLWTSWCGPCVMEKEAEVQMQKRYKDKDVEFVSLCCSDSIGCKKIIEKYGIQGHHYFLAPTDVREVMNALRCNCFPYYLLVNREGVIVDFGSGLRPERQLTLKKIDRLLQE